MDGGEANPIPSPSPNPNSDTVHDVELGGALDKDEFRTLWGVLRFGSGRKVMP